MHQPIAELHISGYKPHKTHEALIRSDEGLASKRQPSNIFTVASSRYKLGW